MSRRLWKVSSCCEHRPQSVTTLPFAQWQAVSGLTLIACACFPDWLLWERAAFQFNLAAASVNTGSHLTSQIHLGLSDMWTVSRYDGGLRRLEVQVLLVWLTGLGGTRDSALLPKMILTGNAIPSDELPGVSSGLSFVGPLVRVGSWYRFSQAQSAERLEVEKINTFHF